MEGLPSYWLPAFLRFCEQITITSKEDGRISLSNPYLVQRTFLSEVNGGLEQGIHHFVALKARQLGVSTILLALDIFWLYMFEGMQGALIFDTAKNLLVARRLITEMLASLPPEWSVPVRSHNREELVLANGSTLQYMSAGRNSKLGISRAINYCHASEIGNWEDQEGIENLKAALAQENPHRLYIFESTAFGFNTFYDMCKDAKESSVQKFIFLGWYLKEIYRIKRDTEEFARWWGAEPQLSEEEAVVQAIVQEQYGFVITPEQWAWYRRESFGVGEQLLKQKYPSHEEEAFQATGTSFFALKRVTADMAFLHKAGVRAGYQGYRYHLGNRFTSLKIEQVGTVEEVQLRVWEQPRKNASYVIGVDVAYGRDEEADRSCVSVWRCYSDKLVQVAEYNTPDPETRQVAWVLAHLAGCYRGSMVNLEITGPGADVMSELKYLKEQIQFGHLRETSQAISPEWALDQMRWFLYSRPDSVGPNYAYNWKTSSENKQYMLNRFRNDYGTEDVLIRSIPLLSEMQTFVQDGFTLHAKGRNKDDRVMAAGLAHFAWCEWVRSPLMAGIGNTYLQVTEREANEDKGGVPIISWIVPQMLANYEADKQAEADRIRRLTEV